MHLSSSTVATASNRCINSSTGLIFNSFDSFALRLAQSLDRDTECLGASRSDRKLFVHGFDISAKLLHRTARRGTAEQIVDLLLHVSGQRFYGFRFCSIQLLDRQPQSFSTCAHIIELVRDVGEYVCRCPNSWRSAF